MFTGGWRHRLKTYAPLGLIRSKRIFYQHGSAIGGLRNIAYPGFWLYIGFGGRHNISNAKVVSTFTETQAG